MPDDNFDDLIGPDDGDEGGAGKKKSWPCLFVGAVCLNSVEHEIDAEFCQQPALFDYPEFEDLDGKVTFLDAAGKTIESLPEDTPEQAELKAQLAASYAEHRAIARSLGVGNHLTWADYEKLCRAEGLTPLTQRNYK